MTTAAMPGPLVSIVIPAFNRADCLAEAVASIQAQTYRHWELIVVDDGSTDRTSMVAEELARAESRLRVVRCEQNRGAQAARNEGINAARGDWVAFLDSDDAWLPDSLALRLRLALETHVSVVYSGCDMLREDGVLTRYQRPAPSGWIYGDLLLAEGPMFQSLLIARDALRRIGGLDERIVAFQEWDTALSLARYYEFGYVSASTFVWDCRRNDTMSKNYLRAGQGYEQVFRRRQLDILRVGGPGAVADHYRRAAVWYEAAHAVRPTQRCSRMATLWSCLDARAALRRLRDRLWARALL
jgi:glycosyltransferase involved in cell wall biosynthesis